MRVIAGSAKGRQLKAPRGMNTRPTADRVKEALFNILGLRIVDSLFLDLFSGTGNMAIEAISRGAQKAVLLERQRNALQVIKANLTLTGFDAQAEVMAMDVQQGLALLGQRMTTFNIIFIDPPYLKGYEQPTLEGIINNNLLAGGGIVVIESSKLDRLPALVGNLVGIRQERYGDTVLSFYSKQEQPGR